MSVNPTLVRKKVVGDLEALPLFDICQFLMIGRKTGTLRLESRGRHGTITTIDGQVVGAVDENLREGEAAFHRLLSWTAGTFEFAPGPVAAGTPSRITTPTDALLLDAARRMDEEAAGDAVGEGGARATAFLEKQRFARELADLFSSLEATAEEDLDFRKEVPLETLLSLAARRGAWCVSLRAGETPKARGPHGWAALGRSPVTQRASDRIASHFLGGSEKILLEMRERIARERIVEGFGYVRLEAVQEEDLRRVTITLLESEAPAAGAFGLSDRDTGALLGEPGRLLVVASAPRGGKSSLAATLAAAAAGGLGRHVVFYEEARRFRLREEAGILEQCDLSPTATPASEMLEQVWRRKADVLVIDAVRSAEHAEAAAGAARAGALVIAAVEAPGAPEAVDRIVRLARDEAQPAVTEILAERLAAALAVRPGGGPGGPRWEPELLPWSPRLVESLRAGDLAALDALLDAPGARRFPPPPVADRPPAAA